MPVISIEMIWMIWIILPLTTSPITQSVKKYLQVFFIFVDVVETENVWVFDEFHDSDFTLHLIDIEISIYF